MVYASIWVYENLHDATLCICSVNKLVELSGSVCLIAVCNLQQLQQKSEPTNHRQFVFFLFQNLSYSQIYKVKYTQKSGVNFSVSVHIFVL